jgi:hypothetical protein
MSSTRRLQRLAISVARLLQRSQRLRADDIARHQPQTQRPILPGVMACRRGQRMRAEQCLAAAGRDADADVRRRAGRIDEALSEIRRNRIRRIVLLRQRRAERDIEAGFILRAARQIEKASQRIERFLLILLELQSHAFFSGRLVMLKDKEKNLTTKAPRTPRSTKLNSWFSW